MLIIAFIKGWRTFFYGCKDFIIVYIAKTGCRGCTINADFIYSLLTLF